jgi:adenosylhomocysteine nucleosidase
MLEIFLRNWLQNAARQKIYEAAQKAAQEQFAGGRESEDEPAANEPAESSSEPKQRPCDVAVVFALGIEAGGLEDRLSGAITTKAAGCTFIQGGLQGRHIALVAAGVGQQQAAAATEVLIAGHRPAWVISAGFAGGLQPQLKQNDFLLASEIADASGRCLAIDLFVSPDALARTPGVHVGKLLTVDKIVHRAADKQTLGEQHQALAVDMESLAVAEVCRQQKTRFLSVRIVSDPMDHELPPDIDRLVRQNSKAGRLGAAVGAVVGRPSSVKEMLKLKEDALIATDRLAKFLEGVIVQLTPLGQPAAATATPQLGNEPRNDPA